MPRKDPRIDAYIAKAQPFARPILKHLRATVLSASPELEEGHQREYLEWITEAKTDATRDKRIATTLEWLTEGKRRNWKYERK